MTSFGQSGGTTTPRRRPVNALDTMRALASKGEVLQVNPGELIFASGESGDCMFGLLEGLLFGCLEDGEIDP